MKNTQDKLISFIVFLIWLFTRTSTWFFLVGLAAGLVVAAFNDKYIVRMPSIELRYRSPIKENVKTLPQPSEWSRPTPTATPTKAPKRVSAVPEADVELAVKLATVSAFGDEHWQAMKSLVFKESSWNPYAVNKSSGACGLFQALPCSKMGCELSDIDCQAKWGVTYIADRYGNPNNAWAFWRVNNWY